MTLSIVHLYYLVGAILAITAVMTLADRQHTRRHSSAFFWGLYSLVFLVGDLVPPVWVGVDGNNLLLNIPTLNPGEERVVAERIKKALST